MSTETRMKAAVEQRLGAWEAAKAILDTAETETRDLSAEEQAAYEKAVADVDAFDEELRALDVEREREERATEYRARYAGILQNEDTDRVEVVGDFNTEVRAAFAEGRNAHLETRDLTAGVANDGGVTVPTSMADRLVEHLEEISPIRRLSTVWTTESGEDIQVPRTNTYSTAAVSGETGTNESDPSFRTAILSTSRYTGLVQVSRQLLEDSAFDIADFVSRQLATQVGQAADEAIMSSLVTDILDAGLSAGTTVDNLIDLQHAVASPYRNANAAYVAQDDEIATLRKLKDSTGQYIWSPSTQVGQPNTLLGFPIFSDPYAKVDASTPYGAIVFGDWKRGHFYREVGVARIEMSVHSSFSDDLVDFKAVYRAGGVLADPNALRKVGAGDSA